MVFNCNPFNRGKDNNPEELFVKGIKGVESVKRKMKKEVELIFPSIEAKGDRDENKGTKASRVMPIPENDIANEKIGEGILDLKIKLNCESCIKNLQKILQSMGLELLNIETERNLVTVRGTVDMTELRSRIKKKLKKDIEVINVDEVMAPTKKDNAVLDKDRDAGAIDEKYKGKSGGSIVKSTVVLNIVLHCDGCIKKIREAISKCRGVETVSVNVDEDLVTVEGTMDVQELTSYLKEKMKRNVEVVF